MELPGIVLKLKSMTGHLDVYYEKGGVWRECNAVALCTVRQSIEIMLPFCRISPIKDAFWVLDYLKGPFWKHNNKTSKQNCWTKCNGIVVNLRVYLVGEMKKWEDRKDLFIFSLICFGWRGRKVKGLKTFLFCWDEKWEDRNEVGINLPLCPY